MEHPITPPPELVGEWLCSEDYLSDASTFSSMTITSSRLQNVATLAARWGADQELEACVEWVEREIGHGREWGAELRAARRPKPPSLAEQGLELVDRIEKAESVWNMRELDTIRRALERLQELENQ